MKKICGLIIKSASHHKYTNMFFMCESKLAAIVNVCKYFSIEGVILKSMQFSCWVLLFKHEKEIAILKQKITFLPHFILNYCRFFD